MFQRDTVTTFSTAPIPNPVAEPVVVTGVAAAEILVESEPAEPEPELELEAEVEVEPAAPKTLRELLYSQEPWRQQGNLDGQLNPGIRRLMEKRVNRILGTVADWMLGVAEERIEDDMSLVVLLELAEKVREQIVWPELEAANVVLRLPKRDQ